MQISKFQNFKFKFIKFPSKLSALNQRPISFSSFHPRPISFSSFHPRPFNRIFLNQRRNRIFRNLHLQRRIYFSAFAASGFIVTVVGVGGVKLCSDKDYDYYAYCSTFLNNSFNKVVDSVGFRQFHILPLNQDIYYQKTSGSGQNDGSFPLIPSSKSTKSGLNFIADAVERVKDSVVNISVETGMAG